MSSRYVNERSPNWFKSLREFLAETPGAAVGEVAFASSSFVLIVSMI